MIKRRFYKLEHGEKDGDSDSASSSDSEVEPQSSGDDSETEAAEEEEVEKQQSSQWQSEDPPTPESSSGYESGDSYWDELEAKYPGTLDSEDEVDTETHRKKKQLNDKLSSKQGDDREKILDELEELLGSSDDKWYILKLKSVYKCIVCPTVICLNEETLIAHLKSKKHARSKKLLAEGRLGSMLNNLGIPETDGLIHAERNANILIAKPDDENETKKLKPKGRQRQKLRLKRKREKEDSKKCGEEEETPVKKKREKNNSKNKSRQESEKPVKKKREENNSKNKSGQEVEKPVKKKREKNYSKNKSEEAEKPAKKTQKTVKSK